MRWPNWLRDSTALWAERKRLARMLRDKLEAARSGARLPSGGIRLRIDDADAILRFLEKRP